MTAAACCAAWEEPPLQVLPAQHGRRLPVEGLVEVGQAGRASRPAWAPSCCTCAQARTGRPRPAAAAGAGQAPRAPRVLRVDRVPPVGLDAGHGSQLLVRWAAQLQKVDHPPEGGLLLLPAQQGPHRCTPGPPRTALPRAPGPGAACRQASKPGALRMMPPCNGILRLRTTNAARPHLYSSKLSTRIWEAG